MNGLELYRLHSVKRWFTPQILFFLIFSCSLQIKAQDYQAELVKEQIENIRYAQSFIGSERIFKPDWVTLFYQSTNYQLAWNDGINVAMLLALLQCASDEGLNPQEYHLEALTGYYEQLHLSDLEKVYFDILLTDAFMLYGSHLGFGKTNPAILYPDEWEFKKQDVDLAMILEFALREKSLVRAVDFLSPQHAGYKKLKEQLQYFRKIVLMGGWPSIPEGEQIDSGMIDYRIPLIRQRLMATRQLAEIEPAESLVYDSVIVSAIKKFQRQYGLAVDGVIGKNTLASLNLTVGDHIRKIEANLERYRWMADRPLEKYIWINIPDFQLELYSDDSVIMSMRAIVGRPDRKTPVLESDIHYLILNPTWTVPPTILEEDVLPAVRRNIKYLERNNLRVISHNGEEIDPNGLPWENYNARNFPYQIRQDPGPSNSLGLIKFQFPNNHRIFLHDTNHPNLFSTTNRALSSGCIRIEHPFALATYLLKGTSWTERQVEKKIESGKTFTVMFPQPVPVYLLYFTAFTDDEDVLQMRNDIYNWDDRLISTLSASEVH